MITRRACLGSLFAALTLRNRRVDASAQSYRVGITDAVISGKPNISQSESMAGTFEVQGKSKCEFEIGTASDIVKRLDTEELNLAVLGGLEYAWLKASYSNLIPLVTAYTLGVRMKACVVVCEESQDKTLMDLQGDSISLPRRLKRHNYVYLHHAIQKHGGTPDGFFDRVETPTDSDEGIESVIAKRVDAILLDCDSWKAYQERKATRSKKLRVLEQSGAFPTPVVLYNRSHWKTRDILLLRVALCTAHHRPYSRQMLNLWGVNKLVLPGREYQHVLEEVLKEYPEPFTPTMMLAKTK